MEESHGKGDGMSKRDRQGVRTAADIERKYNLGEMRKQSRQQTEKTNQLMQLLAEYESKISKITSQLANLYPVGSIYISVNDTEPSTVFGGSWELVKQGYLVVGNDSESDFAELEYLDKCNVWKRIEDVTAAEIE